jgi:hypothetical protein
MYHYHKNRLINKGIVCQPFNGEAIGFFSLSRNVTEQKESSKKIWQKGYF